MKGLFLFSIFVITYGSLFPFEFQYVDWRKEGLTQLLFGERDDGGVADILGNIFLFIPFGFAGTALASRRPKTANWILTLVIFGGILAVTVQFLQIYIDYRVPALYDAGWNLVGIVIGSFLARFIDKAFPTLLAAEDRLALAGLATSWIFFLLVPFVFSFNMDIVLENIVIHADPAEYRFANVIFYIAIWITYAKLMDEIKPNSKSFFLSLEFASVVTLSAKIFVYRNLIEPELVAGALIAILLHRSRIFKLISPYKISALILMPTMFYNSLYPFEFYASPFKEFMWIPFAELFSGDMLNIVRIVFYKTFAYGSIIWTLYKSFPNARWVGYFCFVYASLIEYLQHLTLERVGGLTEPLLVLFLCTFIEQKQEKFDLYTDQEA